MNKDGGDSITMKGDSMLKFDESIHIPLPSNCIYDDVRGKDVSVVYGEKNEDEASSLDSLHGIMDGDGLGENKSMSRNNRNRSNNNSRNLKFNMQDHEMDIHRMPTPVTCGGSAMKNKVKRSLLEEIYLEKEKEYTSTTSTSTTYTNTATPDLHGQQRHNNNYHSKKSITKNQKIPSKSSSSAPQPPPPPQDRSVASKLSASSMNSAATPMEYIHNHDPIISPPFTLSSPARNRYNHNKRGSRSERKPSYTKDNGMGNGMDIGTDMGPSSSILSPPKPKSAYKPRRNYQYHHEQQFPPQQNHYENELFHDMKQEIEELRAQFQALDKESIQRNQKTNTTSSSSTTTTSGTTRDNTYYNPEELFQKDVQTMTQKADALADALHRNFVRSNQIHEENNYLRRENHDMKLSMDELQENNQERGMIFGTNNENNDENVKKSPKSLLRDLDPSDDYVKRKYPPVPKTPGTMFTTEFVETMKLDVGEHAYLAEIMDRQWGTSRDYRP